MYRIEELFYQKKEEEFLNNIINEKECFGISFKDDIFQEVENKKKYIKINTEIAIVKTLSKFSLHIQKPRCLDYYSDISIFPRKQYVWKYNYIDIDTKFADEFLRAYCMKDDEHLKFALENAYPHYKHDILDFALNDIYNIYLNKNITDIESNIFWFEY